MNSPYTKHLDSALDAHTMSALPTTYASPMTPMVVHQPADSSGSKATIALIVIVIATAAAAAGIFIGRGTGVSVGDLRRYEQLAGREGEIKGRDAGWVQGRSQGRTEMQYLAKYEQLRTQANAFTQGWRQGLGTGNMMGIARGRGRYGYGGYGYGRGYGRRGYGSYYGGSAGSQLAQAQAIANATGQAVDVTIG